VSERTRLGIAVRNPLSLCGAVVATASAVVFVVVVMLEVLGYVTNPYLGLLLFVVAPVVFIAGLLLIPMGIWRTRRRAARGIAPRGWPVIDLRDGRQRTVVAAVLGLTLVNIIIVSLAGYGGVHYMESSEFCGQVCHTTMEPQAVAHQSGPHARIRCAQCHIGPGVGAELDAKLAGTRQLFRLATNTVPTPVVSLRRPTRETCEQCHAPGLAVDDRLVLRRSYGNDEHSSESTTSLAMHLGRQPEGEAGSGIHGTVHLGSQIDYVAGDASAMTIPYVRLTLPDGTVREYVTKDITPEQKAGARRRMDCMDCHSRPAHTFSPAAGRAVDEAIAAGRMPRSLPFLRRDVVAALQVSYPDRAAALAGIERRLLDGGSSRQGADPGVLRQAVGEAQAVWSRHVFPAMRVTWGTYVTQLGHEDGPGCFRCHDDSHTAADGRVIRQDCALCHAMS